MYSVEVKDFNIKQIADSGQCFRINQIYDNTYSVIAFGKYLEISQKQNTLIFSCSKEEYQDIWESYFDLQTDYYNIVNESLKQHPDIRKDIFLLRAISYGSGIRILRQEFFEIVISFIISQRKSIPAIKTCIEKLCYRYGNKINNNAYTFPSPETLYQLSIEELKECGLGYRADYIRAATEWYLYEYEPITFSYYNYSKCLDILMNIKGIGIKVANCICLFGLHQLNACPIDVWMETIIKKDYQDIIPNWMDSKYAGVLQQYVFYYKRNLIKN